MSRSSGKVVDSLKNPPCHFCGRIEVEVKNRQLVGCVREVPENTPSQFKDELEIFSGCGQYRTLRTCPQGQAEDRQRWGVCWADVEKYQES